jgi:hypothetical protein
LLASLVLSGGAFAYHTLPVPSVEPEKPLTLTHTKKVPPDIPKIAAVTPKPVKEVRPPEPKAEVKKVINEELEAKRFAIASFYGSPQSFQNFSALKASFDPNYGYWTVTWNRDLPNSALGEYKAPNKIHEMIYGATKQYEECKVVVVYTPSDDKWHLIKKGFSSPGNRQ